MYGAGHGGIEAILLAGMTMLSNITLALALNRGGLEAVEAMMGPLSETGHRHRPFDFRQKKIPSPSGSTSVNRPTNAMMMIAVGVTVSAVSSNK